MPAPASLDRIYAAVADPTRRTILDRLSHGPATAGELAAPLPISKPAVSRHLRVLEQAGLLERRVEGRVHHCRARIDGLAEAERWLADRRRFWDRRLQALRELVEDPDDS